MARSLLVNTATSGTRIPITVQGAITHTRVSCATPRNTELYFIVLSLPQGKNRPPIDQLILQRQRPTQPLQTLFLHRAQIYSLQILICSTFALLRAISTLGIEKLTLTQATKILFSRASHMVFILSTTSLLFRQRTAKIIGAPKNPDVKPALDKLFHDELCSHRIQEVHHKPLRVNAIGCVIKKDSGDPRPITDMSRPLNNSVNDYISCESYRYKTIDDAIALMHPGC